MLVTNPVSLKMIKGIMMVCLMMQVVCGEQQIRCIQSERQALLQFKASLLDPYGMLSSWTTNDCCQWMGIQCSNLTGNVLMLDLPGEIHFEYRMRKLYRVTFERYIIGEIHKSLLKLQQLRYLNLSQNSFRGSHIPEFFASLTNLRYLDLSYSDFGGKIPSQFGSFSHLKYLNLADNSLEGSIPYQLGNLSNLQYLDLSDNSLKGDIPSQLGKLSNLQTLHLGGYDSVLKIDNGDHARGQWLSNLTSLTHLYLSSISNLNSSHSWLQMVGKLPKLRELSLYDCSLSDHFILSLGPSKFNFSTSLSVLDLSWNAFTSPMIFQWVSNVSSNLIGLDLRDNNLQVDSIPYHFGIMMNSLEWLDLSSNSLKGGVLNSLMNICTLRSLNMNENNLTENLASILHNLSGGCVRNSLQELDLSNNHIAGSLTNLSIFSTLKRLDLSENQLNGKMQEGNELPSQLESLSIQSNSIEGGIPKSFGNACSLHSLNMFNNSLSEELPMVIYHLSGCARNSLQELNLGMNQINGTLPNNLSIFSSLRELRLDENKLNGRIPEDIRFPTQLEELYMNSNSLEGVIIESHFSNMSKLESLDLSDNSLTLAVTQNWIPSFQLQKLLLRSCKLGPTFPKWLQTQKNLQYLDISNCGISDIVPKWFWAKIVLTREGSVNISYNNLTGTIPNFPLKNSYTYTSLFLASNQFEGSIPPFLGGYMLLDLSKNKFSNFQSFLCANGRVETLGKLDLSNNNLSGQIPNCWTHFKSLAYLDLSHNNFSGRIPTSMGSLLELQALLLRNNSLAGEIPFSLSNCTKLVMLDAGENKLSGPIPYWIGSKVQELRMLSLQKNHFFGSLPFQICFLQNIQLLDLSSNKLFGKIPKCIKNLTLMAQKTSTRNYPGHEFYINMGTHELIAGNYDLNLFLMWKGVEQLFFNNELFLVKSIDLSSNQLSEEIPQEIENLSELVSLNLSRNNLTGKIPSNIGRLTSLEFLDLSRNQISGSIPSSLTKIDRLTMLDLSHNHLCGKIPIGTQLQSYNATSYEDNPGLCGKPLDKLCIEEKPQHYPRDEFLNDEYSFFTHGFYISMMFGFVIGFWGSFGSILIKRSWRRAYFKFLNNLVDNIYVMVAVKFVKVPKVDKGP